MRKSTGGAPAVVQRILLVDDNHNGLLARKAVLSAEGYEVTACSSAAEALKHFAQTPFALLVTDYRMPEMDGKQLIQAVREMRPDIRTVLVSGMVDVLGLNEQNTGADAVIAKNNTEVANMVRTVGRLLRKPPSSQKGRAQRSRKTGA